MSKTALYSKVDILEDAFVGTLFIEFAPDILYQDEYVDCYTELARARLKQLKSDLTHVDINKRIQKEAVEFIGNDELLQFWCDLALLDKGKVKEWLLTLKTGKRKYNSGVRRNGR